MNLGAVLLTGLFAGGISCATVQGGLLTGLVARNALPSPDCPPPLPGNLVPTNGREVNDHVHVDDVVLLRRSRMQPAGLRWRLLLYRRRQDH